MGAAIPFGVTYLHGFDPTTAVVSNTVGALNPKTFNIGRNSYTVDTVVVYDSSDVDGNMEFSLTSDLRAEEKAALRLHVCNSAYDFNAATLSTRVPTSSYQWIDNLDWSSFSARTLYLSLPEGYLLPAAPAGAPSALSAQSVSGKPGYLRLSWTPAPASGSGLQPAHTTDYEARYRKTGAPDWSPNWSFRNYGTPGFDYPPTTHAAPRAETTHRSSTTSTRTPSTRSRCARPTPTVRAGGRTR